MFNNIIIVMVVVAGIFLFSRTQSKITDPTSLTISQLAEMSKRKDFFLVNVHIPYEGEIKKTDAFIPYNKITENLDKLPKNKRTKIVLYCRSGRMSGIATRELVRLGYTQVSHLSGGMIDWEKNAYGIIVK